MTRREQLALGVAVLGFVASVGGVALDLHDFAGIAGTLMCCAIWYLGGTGDGERAERKRRDEYWSRVLERRRLALDAELARTYERGVHWGQAHPSESLESVMRMERVRKIIRAAEQRGTP